MEESGEMNVKNVKKANRGGVVSFRLKADEMRTAQRLAEAEGYESVADFCRENAISDRTAELRQIRKTVKDLRDMLEEHRAALEYMTLYMQELSETIMVRMAARRDMTEEEKQKCSQNAALLSNRSRNIAIDRLVASFTGDGERDILGLECLGRRVLEARAETGKE